MKEALRDESEEEWMEQMQWFEQASKFDPTGCGNGRKICWAKGMIDGRLGELAERVAGFTRGKEALIAASRGSCGYSVLICDLEKCLWYFLSDT